MIKSFTSSEMLGIWRRALGLETRRRDCSVDSFEGIDSDDILLRHIRSWYLDILDTAPAHLIPTVDIADKISLSAADNLWGVIDLPDSVRRPISVRLDGWENHAVVQAAEYAAPNLRNLANRFIRPGKIAPAAVLVGRQIRVTPVDDCQALKSLICVDDPGNDLFVLDEALVNPSLSN